MKLKLEKDVISYTRKIYKELKELPYGYGAAIGYSMIMDETEWAGKIALPYLSDYGYAADLGKCTKQLINYSDSTCASNNWMYSIMAPNYGWSLLTFYNSPNTAWNITSSNNIVIGHDVITYNANGVAPVLYLNSELSIKAGTGTSSSPYQARRK